MIECDICLTKIKKQRRKKHEQMKKQILLFKSDYK